MVLEQSKHICRKHRREYRTVCPECDAEKVMKKMLKPKKRRAVYRKAHKKSR